MKVELTRFIYPAGLAAYNHLVTYFPGVRLDALLAHYTENLTKLDFSPYLRARVQEREERKQAFLDSFLGSALKEASGEWLCSVHPRLWTSPDHEGQIRVAMRHVTNFRFALLLSQFNIMPQVSFDKIVYGNLGRIWD